jgi:hypothetical protein
MDQINRNPNFYEKYHQDFRNLNGKLLEWHGNAHIKDHLAGSLRGTDIEELSFSDVLPFIPDLLKDFVYTDANVNSVLNVFTMEQIIEYMGRSAEMSVTVLERLMEGKLSSPI